MLNSVCKYHGCRDTKGAKKERREEEVKKRENKEENEMKREREKGDTKGCSNSPLSSVPGQEEEKVTLVARNYLVTSRASSERDRERESESKGEKTGKDFESKRKRERARRKKISDSEI